MKIVRLPFKGHRVYTEDEYPNGNTSYLKQQSRKNRKASESFYFAFFAALLFSFFCYPSLVGNIFFAFVRIKTLAMPDNKTKKDGRDSGKVSGSEDYELAQLAEKLGTNKEKIKAAIKAVGNDRKKVEAYLKKMK